MLIDEHASVRLGQERYQAETAFEERYLKPNAYEYEFFGEPPGAYHSYKAQNRWPCVLERSKPDFWLPEAKELYECCGTANGSVFRLRTSKLLAMSYWADKLEAKGFFSIYDSSRDAGFIIPLSKMIEAATAKSTTIESRDNDLYAINKKELGLPC